MRDKENREGQSRRHAFRRFHYAFLLMSVIPILICLYLLFVRFGSIQILLGPSSVLFLLVILFLLVGLGSGRALLLGIIRSLADTTEELGRYQEHLEVIVRERTAKLEAAQLGLLQTARYESVNRLAAGIAHEVRNPLAVIIQGVDYLSEQVPKENKDAAEILDFMRNSVRRVDTIIQSLSDYASPTELNTKPANLNSIIQKALLLINYELSKSQVTVAEELSPDLRLLDIDGLRIQQVFINIFMNALQAIRNRGTITVRTYAQADGDGQGAVVVEVDDTGRGISEENLTRIFEPFFTTKSAGNCPGLGLTVSRKIVEMHEGSISLRNRPEGGVRVTITLGCALKGGVTNAKETNLGHR